MISKKKEMRPVCNQEAESVGHRDHLQNGCHWKYVYHDEENAGAPQKTHI